MVRSVVFLCLGVVSVATVAAAQPPPPPPPPGVAMTMSEDQAPTVGTGAVSGVVTDGTTGRPISGALVALLSAGPGGATPRPRQMTDGRGRFVFTHLPAGDYSLTAGRPGYLDGGYKRTPGVTTGARITLNDGEWFADANVQLWKPASISGTIRDERGEPLVGIPVRILIRARIIGADRWAAGPATTTDDRGVYRIAGLLAGDYRVHVPSVQVTLPDGEVALYRPPQRQTSTGAASLTATRELPDIVRLSDGAGVLMGHYAVPGDATRGVAYPQMFYPAARTLDLADVVQVAFGDERTDVDVQLQPVSTVSVSGQVIGPVEAIAALPVRLVPRGSETMGQGAETGITTTDAQGLFTFHRVPEGDYTILASRTVSEFAVGITGTADLTPRAANPFVGRSSSTQVAGSQGVMLRSQSHAGVQATGRATVSVGAQPVTGLTIPLGASFTVSGHFEWDGSETPPADVFPPSVRLEPADGDVSLGLYFAQGPRPVRGQTLPRLAFTIDNVLPGRYVLGRVLAGAGWNVAGADWNGQDVLSTPLHVADKDLDGLVIRMTTQETRITGSVRDQSGAAAAEGAVLLFPAAPAAWRQAGVTGTRFTSVTITSTGTFDLRTILPGEYFLAAVPVEDRNRWNDPAFLESLVPQATRVTVAPGSALTHTLRIKGGER